MRSIFYIFAININRKWILYINDTKTMTWRVEKNESINLLFSLNKFVFSQFFVIVNASIFCQSIFLFYNLQSIRTRRLIKIRKIQIREVWNSIRSRNRYRFVVFAFVFIFVLFWDIDRFIILICRCFREQNFQQDFHFRNFRFFIFAFLFLLLHLFFHAYRICFESFCFNRDQIDIWFIVDEFFRNVDR